MSSCQNCNRDAWHFGKEEKLCFHCKMDKEVRFKDETIAKLRKALESYDFGPGTVGHETLKELFEEEE